MPRHCVCIYRPPRSPGNLPAAAHPHLRLASHDISGPKRVPTTGTVSSANFGVPAAVQLHDVGVVAAPWLCDVGVLAAVQLHDTEAAPGDQLAQVPHPAHARERDSYGGGEDRAAK